MKKKILCISYLLCIVSCTTDTAIQNSGAGNNKVNNEFVQQNYATIYSAEMEQYYKAINSYREKYGFPETVEELTLQMQAIEASINNQRVNNSDIAVSDIIVSDILKNPEDKLQQMMQENKISFAAQESLLRLTNILFATSVGTQTNFHDNITVYESEVIQNQALNAQEKQMVLSLSSISTFLVSMESDRKDRDWEKAVTSKSKSNKINERQVSFITLAVIIKNITVLR
jgi:hypothetical protein